MSSCPRQKSKNKTVTITTSQTFYLVRKLISFLTIRRLLDEHNIPFLSDYRTRLDLYKSMILPIIHFSSIYCFFNVERIKTVKCIQ